MKTKSSIMIALLLLGFVSCNSTTKEKKNPDDPQNKAVTAQSGQMAQPCEGNSRATVPRDQDKLNDLVFLNYDLSNNCTFQPMHLQVRDGFKPSSYLIGRFHTRKSQDLKSVFLDSLELKYFEIGSQPEIVVVNSASVDRIGSGMLTVQIGLKKVTDSCCEAERNRWNNGEVDMTYVLPTPIEIFHGDEFDVHMLNEEALYGERLKTEAGDYIPRGRQCHGIARIDNNDQ